MAEDEAINELPCDELSTRTHYRNPGRLSSIEGVEAATFSCKVILCDEIIVVDIMLRNET